MNALDLTCAQTHTRRGKSVLIVGAGALGRITGESIAASCDLLGYLRFEGDRSSRRLPAPLLGAASDFEACLRTYPLDEIYIAGDLAKHAEEMREVVRTCELLGLPFALPAQPFRLTRARPRDVKALADGYIHYVQGEPKPAQAAMKRAMDIVLALTALLILSPLLLATAIAVKLTSKGPVLFRQARAGMRGRPFAMLKFRRWSKTPSRFSSVSWR